jgi:transcriptional regulator with XRE-family HTH domain
METYDKQALTFTSEDAKVLTRGTQGIEFRILRKKADFTLQEVANRLRDADDPLSTAMLSLFERGKKDLRPATLARLEKIYGVTAEKSKESAAEREGLLRTGLLYRLPWLNPAPEPRGKSAKAREIQQLRRENAELHFRVESAEFQLKKNTDLLNSVLKSYQELQKFMRQHAPTKSNKAFYGEQ